MELTAMKFSERVSCTVKEGVEGTGLSRSRIYEAIADGRLKSKMVNGRRLLIVESLLRFVSPEPEMPPVRAQRGNPRRELPAA
jgi:excisionase family DNA binding protein